MVTKNQSIELIAGTMKPETPGYRSIVFRRPPNFTFEAGDWIDIEFNDRVLGGGKTYSISSSPTENDIMITFRDGISQLKRALQAITPDDTVVIAQYGNDYDFRLNKNQSSVLIAGGVGIAPFRSMLKEMYDNGDRNDVTLIYLNQNDTFLFKSELDEWVARLPNVTIEYIVTKDLNRKKREKLVLSLIRRTNQNFYISGPPGMVDANEHLLIDFGVRVADIRIDSFGGY